MFGECHAHIFMNGYDYKKAVRDQQNGPVDSLIREHFAAYRRNGITYVRDGGDPWGVSKRGITAVLWAGAFRACGSFAA